MLKIESSSIRPLLFARRAAAMAVLACASTGACYAQQSASAQPFASAQESAPVAPLLAGVSQPMDLAALARVSYSSSSSSTSDPVDPTAASTLGLTGVSLDALQPPPRRRYGRPRYNDSSHNPDGSNKYEFVVGAGLTAPVADTKNYLNTDYAFQFGGGRRYSKNFAVLLQFDYDHFGFTGNTLNNQAILYGAQGVGLDGKSHIWSFTLDPVYNFYNSEGLGAYVVGGVGFFHKTANFTVPSTGYYEDGFGNIYEYSANQTIDKYTSNAPGFDGGIGMTYKPSRFAGERFFIEARFNYMLNSQRFGITVQNENANLNYTGNNFFPYNSNRTSWIPIKAGLRF